MKKEDSGEVIDSAVPKFGEGEYPLIAGWDDLMSLQEAADKFSLKVHTLREMRYGEPRMPYIRFGAKIWISKVQFVWFLNKWQREKPDKYYLDRKRRARAGLPIGRGRPRKE